MAEQAAARTRRKGQEAESHVHQANRWEAPSRPAQSRRLNRVFAAASEVNEAFLPSNPRRQMYEHEVRAATDFSKLETVAQGGVDSLLDKWGTVKEKQIDELASLIKEAKGDLTVLSDIQAKPIGADVLKAEMSTAMKEGAAAAREEAIRQGLKVPAPKLTEAEKQIAARAEAVDRLLARSLSEAASRQAVARSGTSLTPQQVADQVKEYLVNLSESYLKDQFNGAVMQAMNTGRREVMAREAATIYASELADESSCDECVSIDGTEYGSLDDADQDYPTGGYVECRGGPNCRGTLIAVYGESETEQ